MSRVSLDQPLREVNQLVEQQLISHDIVSISNERSGRTFTWSEESELVVFGWSRVT
jgi:hypothetical protein